MRVQHDLTYAVHGEIPLQLDLYLPTTTHTTAAIIWIHGGGWKYGSRKDVAPQFLVDAGFIVACISYRLTGISPFPAMIQDCRSAVRWLRTHHARYNLNPEKIGALGESAGGHLCALLALTPHMSIWDHADEAHGPSAQIQAAVPVCGVTDVEDL